MFIRRSIAVVASLFVALTVLTGLTMVTSSPAQAFALCTATKTGPSAPIKNASGSSTVFVKAPSRTSQILSVGVTVNITHPKHRNFTLSLKGPDMSVVLSAGTPLFGGGNANFTNTRFSDGAAKSIADAPSPRTGKFKPAQPLSDFEEATAAGEWKLVASRELLAARNGTINSWKLTIRYDCDTDGDDARDTRDNCPEKSNPKQEDNDRDGLGDVCDPNPDSDGIPAESDNCPMHRNPGQADLDRDGLGDVCDDDADGDGYEVGDLCPLGHSYSDTGCPSARRTTTIAYNKKQRAFRGKISSPRRAACAARQRFFLVRVPARGAHKRMGPIRSTASGAWTMPRKARPAGRYYVLLPDTFSPTFQCREFRSRTVVAPRR